MEANWGGVNGILKLWLGLVSCKKAKQMQRMREAYMDIVSWMIVQISTVQSFSKSGFISDSLARSTMGTLAFT